MADREGRLAENILMFARTLRGAGIPLGSGQVLEALAAIARTGIGSRRDVYFALRAILVKQPSERRLFDQAFHVYFRNPRLLERMMSMLLPGIDDSRAPDGGKTVRRLLETLAADSQEEHPGHELAADQSGSWSARELLRDKDFEQMSLAEQQDAKQLIRQELWLLTPRPTRRFKPDAGGERYDLRRSLKQMQRVGGDIIPLARKRRRHRPPDMVLICDISGSMSRYSRMFLFFAHCMTRNLPTVHSFVFGTRLTNISHRLATADADQALERVARDVRDWDGGTRIAESLRCFNRLWTRRVLSRRSVVLLLCDGLERDSESDLAFQMARLRRSCGQLIWLNPLLRFAEFEPRASGIRQMLPNVDVFRPAHNVDSLSALSAVLRRDRARVPVYRASA